MNRLRADGGAILLRPRPILLSLLTVGLLGAAWWGWSRLVAPTQIAVVNFRDFQFAEMLDAAPSRWVRLDRVPLDRLAATNLAGYDAAFVFGRGLNLDEAQRAVVDRATRAGTAIYIAGATNPASDVTSLSGEPLRRVAAYFENGGRRNLASLFRFTRRDLDCKLAFAPPAGEPQAIPADALYHPDDDRIFETLAEYRAYYRTAGKARPGRPTVCLLTSISGPRNPNRGSLDELVRRLEARDLNVVPVAGTQRRFDTLREINPDLVVFIPHGRLAPGRPEEAIGYLQERGIPLICPIGVMEDHDAWLASQKGMQGGVMSQNIVMPELDGGAEPYVIGAQFPDERGLAVPGAIPERVETLVGRVDRWLALRSKPNADKKLAVVYFKGPGQNAMAAAALEVAPSLLNLLRRLRDEGYTTGPLPESVEEFQNLVQRRGPVFGAYAEGAFADFLRNGDPELIPAADYLAWARRGIDPAAFAAVEQQYGPAPGRFLAVERDGRSMLALPRVRFGNVVLLPQLLPALGDDSSKLVHGAKVAPPHPYLATYLYARYGFGADALLHFGTHGSLEFTPWKQNALSRLDWPDALVGDLPHLYLYIINNIGEAIIAKRRSYATLVSHLTPPFAESELYGPLQKLQEAIGSYQATADPALRAELVGTITRVVREQKLHKDLKFADDTAAPLDEAQIEEVHDYLMTVGLEKISRGLYTLGVPYPPERVAETARVMAVDAVAQARARLDRAKGRVTAEQVADKTYFEDHYHGPALADLDRILAGAARPESFLEPADLALAARSEASRRPVDGAAPGRPVGRSRAPGDEAKARPADRRPTAATGPAPKSLTDLERERAGAAVLLRDALGSVARKRDELAGSTDRELASLLGALGGRYVAPSPGGDPIANPDAVPTGRNLVAIDADRTPSEEAWRVGKDLAEATIRSKREQTGQYPKKVAVTLWGGEFISSQGVDVAMIFHLLGVEPVRNARGEVHDVRLVPAAELRRPRVDVVVQTSGQLRDVAATRLNLIDRAIRLAAEADDPAEFANNVRLGTVAAEALLKERGLAPAEARALATARIFGGVNGNYGTGIMGLVEAGDRWDKGDEVADQYLKNMGAIYLDDRWGTNTPGAFEAALQNTDTLVQSRTSSLDGPLSLDHVYEFMGGLNASIRRVTGKEPDAYFADLRNKHKPTVRGAEEAIWVEARSTLLNPKYIRDLQAGGASSAAVFAESFRNTYGWNVMKPDAIADELWDELYAVYIEDRERLGLRQTFERANPFALQEMTAVMMETARKGLWDASPEQLRTLATLHTDLIRDHRPGCSGFVCDNAKLRATIEQNLSPGSAQEYASAIDAIRSSGSATQPSGGMTLEREATASGPQRSPTGQVPPMVMALGGTLVAAGLLATVYLRIRDRADAAR